MSSIDQQALGWMVQRADHGLDAQAQAAFDAWFAADARHRGAWLRALAIENAVAQAARQAERRSTAEPVSTSVPGTVVDTGSAIRSAPRRAWLGYGLAAAVVAGASVLTVYSLPEPAVVLATASGELRKETLADRSVASIAGDSRLEVTMTARARQVTLARGEAWFEVARDASRPFIVSAGTAQVRAVGTAFSVRRLGADGGQGAEVLVTEGRVEVSGHAGGKPSFLDAGDRAVIGAQGVSVERQSGDIGRRLAWRGGRLIFANDTLADAVASFNRHGRKQIVIVDPRLRRKTLVGRYLIAEPEVFARDVGLFLGVPVVVTVDSIRIGVGEPR